MKKPVMTSIDLEIHEQAKEKGLNVSEIAEEALRDKLGKVTVEIDCNLKQCEFCDRMGDKETAEEAKRHINKPNAMTWLWPYEVWICNSCLKSKSRSIIK